MNKKGLDEMQIQTRNKIGNQTFLMLLYLLMIDAGLYGFGFRWVDYPANVMLIRTICAGIYVIRLIKANAYVGPSTEKEKPLLKILMTALVAVVVATGTIVLLKTTSFSDANQINDMSAPILFIAASVGIVIAVVTTVINRIQNKNDGE